MTEPTSPWSTLRGQRVREVGARELRHRTADVVRSVEDGVRVVLTRHARPRAVLISVRDAMELLIVADLPGLAAQAERDLRAGRVETAKPRGLYPVLIAQEARGAWARMHPRDRRQTRVALARGRADDERLLWLPSGRWVVAFSYVDEATALTHQAFEVKALERELIGEEIFERRRRIAIERRMHARD